MSDATTGNGSHGNGSQSQATPQPKSPVGGPPTGRVAAGGTGANRYPQPLGARARRSRRCRGRRGLATPSLSG